MFQNISKAFFRVPKSSNLVLKTSAGTTIVGSVLYYNDQIRDDSIRFLYYNQETFYTSAIISYLGSKVMTFNVSQNLIGHQPDLHKILRNTSKAGLSVGLLGSIIAIGNGLGHGKRFCYEYDNIGKEIVIDEFTKFLEELKNKNLDEYSFNDQQHISEQIKKFEILIDIFSNIKLTKYLTYSYDSYLSKLNVILDPFLNYEFENINNPTYVKGYKIGFLHSLKISIEILRIEFLKGKRDLNDNEKGEVNSLIQRLLMSFF